jgi:hypothetical protein
MPENQGKKDYQVPGRLSLEDLKREEEELKQAQDLMHKKGSPKLINAMSMVSVGFDFALTLALPLIIFAYIGKKLDEKMGTNYIVIIGILVALAVSSIAIAKQIKKLSKLVKK